MSALSRILRATNWKYAFGEIFLIFIGITLALAANSWYENRQDRAEEKEILQQIIFSLNTDIEDLRKTQRRTETKLQLMNDLQKHIADKQPYESTLDETFREMLSAGETRMNTAAFDTLTYRGIDLVSSATLRSRIVDYYDTERIRLQQRNQYDAGDSDRAVPYFNKMFSWESERLLMSPINYDKLVADREFLNFLALRIWAYRTLRLREYNRIEQKATNLIVAIEEHIESS